MPRDERGLQLITFAIEKDEDQDLSGWITIPVRKGDTIAKIAADRGHPEEARRIREANNIKHGLNHDLSRPDRTASYWGVPGVRGLKTIRVPRELQKKNSFDVHAQDDAPRVVGGYAKFQTLNRPDRAGLNVFEGYDPVEMEIPIQFIADRGPGGGVAVENDIDKLERMAGRGNFKGTAVGPPAVIRITATNGADVVPLLGHNYQYSKQNTTALLWRIAGIEWDASPRRNIHGNRIHQLAVVTVRQHTAVHLASRSVAERARAKPKPPRRPTGRRGRGRG